MLSSNKSDALTIVMYHYVRDLERSRYPKIKGLRTDRFIGQLDYLQKYYSIVSMENVVAAYLDGAELPQRPCLLTFDDGFIDHFVTVFPLLEERGLSAGFFPPAQPVLENKLLDVHKLHLVLAASPDPTILPREIFRLLKPLRKDFDIPDDESLYKQYAIQDRFDPIETTFVKRVLTAGLPKNISKIIYDSLFKLVVSEDEALMAREIYMDLSQLRTMARHGMDIGGHGDSHDRLATLDEAQQRADIKNTEEFLSKVYGQTPVRWVMSYPFGDRNETTVRLVQETQCALALLSKPTLAGRELDGWPELPRLDTNDLPCDPAAEPNKWTQMVLRGV